jgi:uncharacterized protein YndB with AHSA1/START domain
MLIRRPVAVVFEAFMDPAITSRFWFSRGSARLEKGSTVTWHWDMYDVSADVSVLEIEQESRIVIGWPTPVEWQFLPKGEGATLVTITASGFEGDDDTRVTQAMDSMGGFSFVLAGCKAWLEHGIALNLVADHSGEAPASPPRTPVILMPDAGRDYPMGRIRALFKADGEETRYRYSISEWWLEPLCTGPGTHRHQAPKGAFVLVPGGTPHDFENRGSVRAGLLNISVPGGFEPEMPGISAWFLENPPGKPADSLLPPLLAD